MSSQRILIVDDEVDILDSLQALLEASLDDVDVRCALSGEDGLEALKDGADLVISDFKMPGMNGLEFLTEVRDRHPEVPRILMTAFPDLQIAVDAINQARIETFFTKPLNPDEVLQVAKEAMQRRRASVLRTQAFARAMDRAKGGNET